MTTITTTHGHEFDFDAVVMLMDDDIREALYDALYDTEQAFYDAYCEAHAKKFGMPFAFDTPNPQV